MTRQPPLRWRTHPLTTVAADDVPGLMRQLAPAAVLAKSLRDEPVPAGPAEPADPIDLPELPEAPREKAAVLLRAAAEVEHALMVQYLYAQYSLTTLDTTIAGVAVEEMSHLITVQNLLRCIGEPPHLLRQDDVGMDEDQKLFPFDFRLEPLSADSLAKYVVAESPDKAPADVDAMVLAGIVTRAVGTQPNPINRVGTLYALLGAVFGDEQTLAARAAGGDPWYVVVATVAAEAAAVYGGRDKLHLPDSAFDTASAAEQASDHDWDRTRKAIDGVRVHQVDSRGSALDALQDIGLQGEGPSLEPAEKSHFRRFYDQFLSSFGTDGSGPGPSGGILPVPDGPVIRIDPGGTPAPDAVTDETAAAWARLGDLRYALLIGALERFLVAPPGEDRAFLRGWCFAEMAALKRLGVQLRSMPRATGTDVATAAAALPFTAPQWPGDSARWTDLASVYVASRDLADELLPAAAPASTARTLLSELRASDDRKQAECSARAAGGSQRSLTDDVRDVLDWTAGAGVPLHTTAGVGNLRFWNLPRDELVEVELGGGKIATVPEATPEDPDPVAPLVRVLTPDEDGQAFMPRNRRPLAPDSPELAVVRRWVDDVATKDPATTEPTAGGDMTIIAMLQGDTSGDGFLIAPHDGRTFPALLVLRTDAGSTDVTLRSSPQGRLEFDRTTLTVGTDPTGVNVHATEAGQSRQDTAIEVVDGDEVVARLSLSCVEGPIVVHFRGRFEARFATEPAVYNSNPAYTATNDAVGPGWTWILEGEPPFTPAGGNVPTRIDLPVGRQIRFNDPVAARPHAEPVSSVVTGVSGRTAAGDEETFTSGDPLIGEQVNVGPDTYFAGNRQPDPNGPATEESHGDTREVLGLFALRLGDRFAGSSAIGPFTHMSTQVGEHTRVPDSRPVSNGLQSAAAELAEFGLPTDVRDLSAKRIDALVADYDALPAADSPERRNLRRRICHLLSSVRTQKQNEVLAAHPDFDFRDGTLPGGWSSKQTFSGTVDADLEFSPDGSSVVDYLSGFATFTYGSRMFGFHADELCAYHIGSLEPGQGA